MGIQLFSGDKAVGATLTGGSWGSSLDNLLSTAQHRVARSTDIALASTKFNVALTGAHVFRGMMIGPTNLDRLYSYRIRSWQSDAFATMGYDSGWISPVYRVPFGTLPFGAPGLYDGVQFWSDADRAGPWIIHLFDEAVGGQFWSVEIDATGSGADYLDIGRLFMAGHLIPSFNYSYDSNGLAQVNGSIAQTTLDGGKRVLRRRNRRSFQFAIQHLPEAEAFGDVWPFLRDAGFDGEVFVVPETTDNLPSMQTRSFLGRFEAVDALSQNNYLRVGFGAQIMEI